MGGIFGIVSSERCVEDLFYGTDYNSHLGTRRGGMAMFDGQDFIRSIHNIENSYFRTKFEPELPGFRGNAGIGVISDSESQPIMVHSHLGRFGIVTVSKIVNLPELSGEMLARNHHFSEVSERGINPTELVAMLISEEESFEAGIERVFQSIRGSCSMVLLTGDGIIAARDKLGRTPLVLGKKEGAMAISSESTSFANLGFSSEHYLGPGEIAEITADGYRVLRQPGEKMQVCTFLWVYYGYPSSCYEGINVEECRYRCGAALAKRDSVEPDFACGVPDSGIAHAIGYSNAKQVPYKRAWVKYTPTWPRSFMPQNQEMRDLVARMKLIPVSGIIGGKKLAMCDDSIVRGTQLRDQVKVLFSAGAKEVHVRPACPTLIFPCDFLNFSASRSSLDLAGRKAVKALEGKEDNHLEEFATPGTDRYHAMTGWICSHIGATTLKYQVLDDLVEAVGLPKEKLCTHCWDGSSYF